MRARRAVQSFRAGAFIMHLSTSVALRVQTLENPWIHTTLLIFLRLEVGRETIGSVASMSATFAAKVVFPIPFLLPTGPLVTPAFLLSDPPFIRPSAVLSHPPCSSGGAECEQIRDGSKRNDLWDLLTHDLNNEVLGDDRLRLPCLNDNYRVGCKVICVVCAGWRITRFIWKLYVDRLAVLLLRSPAREDRICFQKISIRNYFRVSLKLLYVLLLLARYISTFVHDHNLHFFILYLKRF